MRLSDWPGRFVTEALERRGRVTPTGLFLSPLFWVTSVLSFLFYLPGVGTLISWTDSGELIASATTLGIPHPTGYPLFSMLSRFVVLIIPWGDPVIVLHLLSACFVSLAAGGVSLIAMLFLGSIGFTGLRSGIFAMISITAGILFATTSTVWDQAVAYEVYGLQALLYVAALVSLLAALHEMESDPGRISPWWLCAGLIVGFGFANHMMTLYLLPGLFFLAWNRLKRVSRHIVLSFGAPSVLGLTAYVFLFVRAGTQPPINWGDPSTPAAFVAHITARQYRVWMFSGVDVFVEKAAMFFRSLPMETGVLVLFFALAGGVVMWKKDRVLFWFSVLLAVFTLAYSFNYNIHDIGTYYLLAYIILAVVAAIGIAWFVQSGLRHGRRATSAVVLVPIVVVLINTGLRHDAYDPADHESPEPFALDVLRSLDSNAALITGAWDFLYSPIMALQTVRRMRPDVRVIDIHLLRDRSWYVRSVLRRFSGQDAALLRKGDSFLAELTKFEADLPFNPQLIRLRWREFLSTLVDHFSRTGPVYADHDVIAEIPSDHVFRPEGYLLRGYSRTEIAPPPGIPEYHPIGQKNDELGNSYRRFCSTVFINHGLYARSISDSALANECFERAAMIDDTNPYLLSLR